jgi:hypothetical protein
VTVSPAGRAADTLRCCTACNTYFIPPGPGRHAAVLLGGAGHVCVCVHCLPRAVCAPQLRLLWATLCWPGAVCSAVHRWAVGTNALHVMRHLTACMPCHATLNSNTLDLVLLGTPLLSINLLISCSSALPKRHVCLQDNISFAATDRLLPRHRPGVNTHTSR